MAKRRRLDPVPVDLASPQETDSVAGLSSPFAAPRRAPIADMAGEAAATAALREVADTLALARAEGLLIQRLPLAAVDAGYLVRDRLAVDPGEMASLIASLRARGQQTAIEVSDLGDGKYGLISGWRRLTALRHLAEAADGPDTVLAIARKPTEAAETYLAMVEENEVRVGLSYYERARIVARAADRGVFADDRAGLSALFAAASRPRRSKIGSFVRIVRALDDHLRFPTAMGERLGLALAKGLDSDRNLAKRLQQSLKSEVPDSPEAEAALIQAVLRGLSRRKAPAPQSAVQPTDPADLPTQVPGLPPGLTLHKAAGRRLILEGDLVDDPAFASALTRWLAAEGWKKD